MRIILSIFFILTLFTNNIAAQKSIRAQKKMIGGKIENIEFTDYIQNIPLDKQFNEKFKILEFWATWCKPCLAAVPHLNKLKSEFKNYPDLIFLSVTYETPEKIEGTLDKIKFETIVVSDQKKKIHNELKIEYNGMMILPRTVLIDNTNKIIWYGTPNELNKELIMKFLKGKDI
ncbi:MAG: TlpA disulfide reductase family protein [Lutibacter sp.]|nr:TlpA disulfide reductase family protein [Lutibacter sp.]